jgi:excisionase family DNA binding protein
MPSESTTVVVLPLSPAELRSLIREELERARGAGAAPPGAPAVWLSTAEAAQLLGVSKKHLEALRARGEGPPFMRVGRAVRYKSTDLCRTQRP